jgi:hypothetical protein
MCLWLSITGLVACGANLSPVLNVEHAPIIAPAGGPQALPVVHDAIIRALIARTWVVDADEPQSITASVSRSGHSATVRIVYGTNSYSIQHAGSSPGLKFDGVMIHKRYNHWVDRLRASIDQELQAVPGPPPAGQPVAAPAPAPAVPPSKP